MEAAPTRTTAAQLLKPVDAVYPEGARLRGEGGTVELELTVLDDGGVGAIRVVKSAGAELDGAAIAAAKQFRFRPATPDGHAVESAVLFDQRFQVQPQRSAEALVHAAPATTPAAGTGSHPFETQVVARGPTSAASASTVRNLDFDLRPKTSPNDLLRVVPGLLAVQHQGGGKADQLFLRGFDADHGTDVGVFFDDIPVNMPSHAHGQGFADLHWLIPEAVEKIDVGKGPYDPRYGDFSTAGAVNLVTRERFEGSSVQLPDAPGEARGPGPLRRDHRARTIELELNPAALGGVRDRV